MREPSDARAQGAPRATAIGATKDAAARRVLAFQEPEGIAGRDTITAVLVRSWNLYHGNTVPPSRRNFLERMVRLAAEDRPAVLCLQELPAWALPRLQGWSGMTVVADPGEPIVVAGDFSTAPDLGRYGFDQAGWGIDHILVRGLPAGEQRSWPEERRRLEGVLVSDHAPVEREVR